MMTKEDALRVILARVAEWDVNVSGQLAFDCGLTDVTETDSVIRRAPELALDHG